MFLSNFRILIVCSLVISCGDSGSKDNGPTSNPIPKPTLTNFHFLKDNGTCIEGRSYGQVQLVEDEGTIYSKSGSCPAKISLFNEEVEQYNSCTINFDDSFITDGKIVFYEKMVVDSEGEPEVWKLSDLFTLWDITWEEFCSSSKEI